jgi:hypothetical protein
MITRAEAKTYLRITSTGTDDLIDTLIPAVESDAVEYLNNAFRDEIIYNSGLFAVSTSTGAGDKITDGDGNWQGIRFSSGMEVYISGRTSNEGLFSVAAVSTNVLTLSSSGGVVAQASSDYWGSGIMYVNRVNPPPAIKPYLAQMIGWRLYQEGYNPIDKKYDGKEGESLSYAGMNEYPERVLNGLKKWRKVRSV